MTGRRPEPSSGAIGSRCASRNGRRPC
jgi:hypothetical protein